MIDRNGTLLLNPSVLRFCLIYSQILENKGGFYKVKSKILSLVEAWMVIKIGENSLKFKSQNFGHQTILLLQSKELLKLHCTYAGPWKLVAEFFWHHLFFQISNFSLLFIYIPKLVVLDIHFRSRTSSWIEASALVWEVIQSWLYISLYFNLFYFHLYIFWVISLLKKKKTIVVIDCCIVFQTVFLAPLKMWTFRCVMFKRLGSSVYFFSRMKLFFM